MKNELTLKYGTPVTENSDDEPYFWHLAFSFQFVLPVYPMNVHSAVSALSKNMKTKHGHTPVSYRFLINPSIWPEGINNGFFCLLSYCLRNGSNKKNPLYDLFKTLYSI